MRQIKATVSGSFTRHIEQVQRAVKELASLNVRVLSPEQPTIVDALDGFVFVASDRHRSVRLVQDRHLASIMNSDFLWLENADGYVGPSAALELGFALALGIPVFSTAIPADMTMKQYVTKVPSIREAVAMVTSRASTDELDVANLLVDPIAATDQAHAALERIQRALCGADHQ